MTEITGTTIRFSKGDTLQLIFEFDNPEDRITVKDKATFSLKNFAGSVIFTYEAYGTNSSMLTLIMEPELTATIPSGTHYWDLMVEFEDGNLITMNYVGKFICEDVAHTVIDNTNTSSGIQI